MPMFSGALVAPMEAEQALVPTMETAAERKQNIAEQWSLVKEARRQAAERQWQINISYYLGNQWVEWLPGVNMLENLKAPPWKRMAVDNRLMPKVRSAITRMIARPGAQVIPDSTDDVAMRAAKFKERILEHVHRESNLSGVFYTAALWGKVCGDSYLEVYWDPDAGDSYLIDGEYITSGDVRIRARSPYEVWAGAGCGENDWGGQVWIGELLPTDMLKARYPEHAEKITADAASHTDLRLRYRLGNFFGDAASTDRNLKGADNLTFVRTRYLFPTDDAEGRKQIIIGDDVIEDLPLEWFGLVHYQNMPNFGSFYGDTELRQAIPRQKTLNRLISSVEEWLRVMKGKWIIHRTNEISDYQPDSEHGEKLEWGGGGPPPTMVAPPQLAPDIWNMMNQCISAIDDLFSDHLASQGKANQNLSGAALNYLIEEDDRQHTPTIMKWEHAIESSYKYALDLAAMKYTPEHRVIIVGEDRRADVESVDKKLLRGTNRVYIALGSSLPKNKTLRQEIIRRNFAEGIYGDKMKPEVQRKTLRQLDAGVVDDVFDDAALDELRAEKENQLMAKGQVVVPQKGEDDQVHNRKHYRYMKTDEYNNLPVGIKIIFEAHTEVHDLKHAAEVLSGMEASSIGGGPLPMGGGIPPTSDNSPEVRGPKALVKSSTQSAEPAPMPGPGVPQVKE